MSVGVGTDGSKKWRIVYCRLRRSARKRRCPTISIYECGFVGPTYPSLESSNRADGTPIPWDAMSGLAAEIRGNRGVEGMVYSVEDSFYKKPRLFYIDASAIPAVITKEYRLTDSAQLMKRVAFGEIHVNADLTVNLDLEVLLFPGLVASGSVPRNLVLLATSHVLPSPSTMSSRSSMTVRLRTLSWFQKKSTTSRSDLVSRAALRAWATSQTRLSLLFSVLGVARITHVSVSLTPPYTYGPSTSTIYSMLSPNAEDGSVSPTLLLLATAESSLSWSVIIRGSRC